MRYAVSYIDFFENELKTEIVEAETEKEAIGKHSEFSSEDSQHWLRSMPDDLDEIKDILFDTDQAVDVVEIPN